MLKVIQNMITSREIQLTIPREPGMVDELSDSLFYVDDDKQISHLVISIVTYMCQLKENIPLIARNTELKRRIETVLASANSIDTGVVDHYASDGGELLEKPKSTSEMLDEQMVEQGNFLTNLWQQYDKRLNSKMILQNEGYYAPTIQVGKYECTSAIFSTNAPTNNAENNNT